MAQAVSHWFLIAEARVLSRVSLRDLGWTKWHWDRFLCEFFGFLCQYHSTIALCVHIYVPGMNNRPVGGRSSETSPHPIEMNKKNFISDSL
jgi:hypothetical protein